jgi:polysaccharide pyruvyl transferase WcaK-like protein
VNIILTNQTSLHNLGDEVILIETLRLLEQTFPGARVAITFHQLAGAAEALPGRPLHQGFEGCAHEIDPQGHERIVPTWRRMSYLARLAVAALMYRLTGGVPQLFAHPDRQALLEELAAADLVLICGGGYLYDTPRRQGALGRLATFGTWSIFPLAGGILAALMGKPLVLLPLSIGPLHDGPSRRAVRAVVRRAAMTFVRERRSLDLLAGLGCAERALCVPDLAFGFPTGPEHTARARALLARAGLPDAQGGPRVGITAIDWGAQNTSFGGQERYERALLSLIDHVTERGQAVLFAHSQSAAPAWDDRRVNQRLRAAARRPERVAVVHHRLPPEVVQAAYGELDCVVGTRMHSLIMAMNAGTPVVAIGPLYKTSGVMREVGLLEQCFDIERVTAEELVRAVDSALGAPEDERVRAYIALARRAKRSIGVILRGLT